MDKTQMGVCPRLEASNEGDVDILRCVTEGKAHPPLRVSIKAGQAEEGQEQPFLLHHYLSTHSGIGHRNGPPRFNVDEAGLS